MWNWPMQILRKCKAVFVLLKHCLCLFHEWSTTVKSMYLCMQETIKYLFILSYLILTVLGGRTWSHVDNSSPASSPYLNCVGQAYCRAVDGASCCTFWLSKSGHSLATTVWPVHYFDVSSLAAKYRLLMICTLYPRHHTFLRLSNWPHTRTALSLSLGW